MDASSVRQHDVNERSWWYRARSLLVRRLLHVFLKRRHDGRSLKILDAGAGTGGMCATLSDFGEVTALEPFAPAADICRSKPYVSLVPSIEQLEKADQVFDLVGAFDVLEHIEDDKKFIAQISEHMDKGAIFIATVPAYQFLWSNHDVAHRHCRRYTRRTLMKLFTEAGFAILYVSYWNRLLLPLAIVARLFGRTGDSRAKPGSIGDRLRYRIVRSEVSLMPAKRFACGTGIVIVAEKIRK